MLQAREIRAGIESTLLRAVLAVPTHGKTALKNQIKGKILYEKLTQITLFAGLFSALTLSTALGQAGGGPYIQVDEYGNMLINGAPGPAGFLSPDPISGFVTLTYALPFAGSPGDIYLFESTSQTNSDLLRFPGNGRLYFFSDANPNDPAEPGVLADGPLPPPSPLASVIFPETGPDAGPNGLFGYMPGGGIGGNPGAVVTYDFFSDGQVPEPNSIALFAFGTVLVLVSRRYRRA